MCKCLPCKHSLTIKLQIYKYIYPDFLMYIYQVLFYSVIWCVYNGSANPGLRCHHQKNYFVSFFASSCIPLLDVVDIYTSTLIIYNSLNNNMFDNQTWYNSSSTCLLSFSLVSYMFKTLVSMLHDIYD